ncbi:hypothetical protein [Falsiroseomonas sp. HW251]|uniref:hypothetical protein n=1 Tax=Falsiroseomonas sp. HW251 TaxID=3390998 RepID=UPI003D30FE55
MPSLRPPVLAGIVLLPALLGVVVAANGGVALGLLGFGLGLAALGWGRLAGRTAGLLIPSETALLLGLAVAAHLLMLPGVVGLGDPLFGGALIPLGLVGLRFGAPEDENGPAWRLALVAAFGFAALWSLDASARYAGFVAGGPIRMWMDVFIHAGTIAQIGDPLAMQRGDIALAGIPSALYHTGSHALAALPVRLGLIAPLDAVTAFWFPLGAAMMPLGTLALGRALGGLACGALALLLFALLPDPSLYGLKHGFLGFHWMMETAPGSLFALPVALAATGMLVAWAREGGWGQLGLAVVMLALTFMLRAHIFVWLVVPFAATAWLLLPWPSLRLRLLAMAAGLPAGIAALLWIGRHTIAERGWEYYLFWHLQALFIRHNPTGIDGVYPAIDRALSPAGAAPIGLVLALLAMTGVLGLLVPLAAAWLGRRRALAGFDLFPLLLAGWACLLMLLAPMPFHGDITDFRQRAFVLLTAVTTAWAARFALLAFPALARPVPLALGAVLALGSAALWLPAARQPRMAWAATNYLTTPLRPGLAEAARWIRAEARPGESFAMLGLDPKEVWFDDATVVIGVAGVPAWLSRPGVMEGSGPPRAPAAARRVTALAGLRDSPDAAAALARLREEGVGFLIARPDAMPAWDRNGRLAAFERDGMRVWRTAPR